MSSEIASIATIYPKPGKTAAVIAGLTKVAEYAKEHETGTLAYSITHEFDKKTGAPIDVVVMIEKYKDQAAIEAHVASEALAAFSKQVATEGLVTKPVDIKLMRVVGGYTSKL